VFAAAVIAAGIGETVAIDRPERPVSNRRFIPV
jgi:hypothetical protein